MDLVGKEGVITVADGKMADHELEHTEGMKVPSTPPFPTALPVHTIAPPRLSAVMNTVKRHPFPHQACSLCRDLHFKGFSEPCHVPSREPARYLIFCSMGILQVPCCKGRVPCSHAAKCRIDPRPAAQLDKCSN